MLQQLLAWCTSDNTLFWTVIGSDLAIAFAYFAIPRYVAFRDSLPKTPSERVEKYKLKAEGVTADCWDREAAGIKLKR
mgnify:CR=1 FL=1